MKGKKYIYKVKNIYMREYLEKTYKIYQEE